MARSESKIPIYRWPGGWCLVGKGPSCLLFKTGSTSEASKPDRASRPSSTSHGMEVTHLSSGLHRNLRKALKGYRAINRDGELEPLVSQLLLADCGAVYDALARENAPDRKLADYAIILEIQELVWQFPDPAEFDRALGRLISSVRAARQIAKYRGPPAAPESRRPSPPGTFFSQVGGQDVLVLYSLFVFKCEPDSPFATCAQELWRKEQASRGDQLTSLYRIPSRKDIREHLNADEPRVTKLCRAGGFDWLPTAAQAVRAGYQEPPSHRRRPR
jgi:hypothetical protein